MGELDNLMIARENNDVEYLKEWSRRACKEHERLHQEWMDFRLKAIKWDKIIDSLGLVFDKDDLALLEFGKEW